MVECEGTDFAVQRFVETFDALLGIRERLDRFLGFGHEVITLLRVKLLDERLHVLFKELNVLVGSLNGVAGCNEFFLRYVRVLGGS